MLEARELECERGGKRLFRALSLALAPGGLVRVAGPNGSGKTSLLRILCGLLAPTAGEVLWDGVSIRSLKEEYSRQLVYLGHAPAVKDDLSAAENLAISCALAGRAVSPQSIAQALERFGVPQGPVLLRKLSQGQRRRAALARLVLGAAAPLWLLDEPFSALDREGVSLLGSLIEDRARRGGAVVFTTHQDPGIAAARVIELG